MFSVPALAALLTSACMNRLKNVLSQLNSNMTLYFYYNREMEVQKLTNTLHVHVEGIFTEIDKRKILR